MRTQGKVTWFKEGRGFGFIKPDGGGDDVFAHYSEIKTEGFRTLLADEPVVFDLVDYGKGPMATNITPVGRHDLIDPPSMGVVKWFNVSKGFGFINPDDGSEEVFAHYTAIQMTGMRVLVPNQRVRFRITEGSKGRIAHEISPLFIVQPPAQNQQDESRAKAIRDNRRDTPRQR